jgi:peptide/nickel transport system permease protein
VAIQAQSDLVESVAVDVLEAAAAQPGFGHGRLNATLAYVLRRVGLYAVTLWGASTASFLFFRLIPGDPIGSIVAQLEQQGQYGAQGGSEAIVAYYRTVFGLDGNLFDQYVHYLNRVLIHGDFGPSIVSYPVPAAALIIRALPWTLGLLGSATLLAWTVGVCAGTFVGWARRSRFAGALTNFALLLSHVPAYFVALFLVFVLAYQLALLPANSAYDASLAIGWDASFVLSVVQHAVIPVAATALVGACNWLITTRVLVVNLLGEDYLTFASAKGLPARTIVFRYVLRNSWLPQITALGITLGAVINGNVLVERLFRYPGIGNLLVDAILVKDVNTAQGIVFLLIFLVLTLNLVIDLCLPLFDPRVKYIR